MQTVMFGYMFTREQWMSFHVCGRSRCLGKLTAGCRNVPAGSGGAQETLGCGNIRAVKQWKPCVGEVKKSPGRQERSSGYTEPLTCSIQHTSKRKTQTEDQCTIHTNTKIECVYVFCVLCL